jgi:TolB protein
MVSCKAVDPTAVATATATAAVVPTPAGAQAAATAAPPTVTATATVVVEPTPTGVQAAATKVPTPTGAQATAAPTPTPTGVATAAPPEVGGLIAFSARIENNWDIYALNPATGEQRRLTADPAEDRYPAFSPDGQRLAFASRRGGHWDLYALAPDGQIVQLAEHPAYDGAPAWSPDGTKIAFESMRSGDLDVWVLDLAAGDPVNLTPDSPAADCDPVWSPDGTRVAFTSWRFGDADIFALDLASGEVRQLTSAPSEERLVSWSEDDELFYTVTEGERQEIYVRSPDRAAGVEGTRLTRLRYVDAPVPSSDGEHLAYLYRHTHGAWLFMRRYPATRDDLPQRLMQELPVFGPLSWTDVVAPWREAEGDPVVLYTERTSPGDGTSYDLKRLEGVDVGNPWLSDRVDDSFWAMRQRIVDETGHDFLAQLSDAWRAVSFDSSRSQYTSWHKAGRAIDTLLDYLSPNHRERWLEIVLERGGGETYWRLYLKCEAQDGSQGMPLKVRPWDATAAARRNGRGGQRKPMPNGYYVDLTDLMAQYGWLRIASHDRPDFHWYVNFMAMEYWHFQKTEDIPWYDAMLELFPADVIEMHHRWEVQKQKGMPIWLAQVKGILLPWEERKKLEMLAP